MKVLIQYHQRLGDVLRMLPLAKLFADRGDEVFFECKNEYADILKCTTYVKHKKIDDAYEKFDYVFNREVWPLLYEEYRRSDKRWEEFVFGKDFPEAVDQRVVLDNILIAPDLGVYDLVAPFGISQMVRHDPMEVIKKAVQMYGKDNLIVLCPNELDINGLRAISCRSVAHMPHLIQKARNFLGINSSPAIVASAVRESYDLIPTGVRQDDYTLGANIISL
jgi:UDP:flavonoid glycosyltransferase YjiC (YdhE family)